MKLYHGSTVSIDLACSKPNKDFGCAFYLSADEQQALEMAQFRAEFEDSSPVINVLQLTVNQCLRDIRQRLHCQ